MGISAASIAEVRDTGSTTNGGYYDGTITNAEADLTQTPSGIAVTFTSSGSGNVITITSGNAASLKIGNCFCITGGTNVNQGWYQLTGRSGNDCTLSTRKDGTSVCSGAAVSGTGNHGGAFKFGATSSNRTDDDFMEAVSNSGSAVIHVTGSHTTGGAISISAAGTAVLPINLIGYGSARNDNPSIASGNQPSINFGSSGFTLGNFWNLSYLTFTGTSTNGVILGTGNIVKYCKVSNTSGTSNRAALIGANNVEVSDCEVLSTNGYAIVPAITSNQFFRNNYIHDSVAGFRPSGAASGMIILLENIIDTISGSCIDLSAGAFTGVFRAWKNTLYSAATPTGSSKGINIAASSGNIDLSNNIITGAVTGIDVATGITKYTSRNNLFYNNTSNASNWTLHSSDITGQNPNFVDAPNGNFETGTAPQRAAYPANFPANLTSSFGNIGAVVSKQDGWYTDVPVAKILTSQGDIRYSSLSNNRTPTYDDTNLTNANMRNGTSFGVSGNGTLAVPAASNVRSGIAVDAGTGTCSIPTAVNVRSGTAVDATVGTLIVPAATDVRDGVVFDEDTEGTVKVPVAADVKHGVDTDVAGVGEYRGEDLYDVVAADELKIGLTRNQDGESILGTYAALERYDDVPEAKVDNGFAYRYNSLVNNRLGESTGATVILDVLTEALLESNDSGATIEAY